MEHENHYDLLTESDPEKLYRMGLSYLERQLPGEARRAFALAHAIRPEDQRYRSYYGMAIALADRDIKKALDLCGGAMKRNYLYPDLYRNLGRVYLLSGQRRKAYGVFQAGLRVDCANRDLRREIEQMGVRRSPVFSFLKRSNPINHLAGKIRHALTVSPC